MDVRFVDVGNVGGTYLGPVIMAPQVAIVALGITLVLPRYIEKDNKELELQPRKIVRK